MTKLTTTLGIGFLAVLLCALPALASDRDNFQAADANGDGHVTYDEARGIYPTLPKSLFDQADEDKNGVLDEPEYGSLQGLTAGFPVGG
jgi:hypothetical protein